MVREGEKSSNNVFSRERLRRVPFKNLLWYSSSSSSAHHHLTIIIIIIIIISSSSSSSHHHHHHHLIILIIIIIIIFIIISSSPSSSFPSLSLAFLFFPILAPVVTKNVPVQPFPGKMRFSGQKVPKTDVFLRFYFFWSNPLWEV